MTGELSLEAFPELFIGLAGPMGVDIDAVTAGLKRALTRVGYATKLIKVTDEMMAFEADVEPAAGDDFYNMAMFKIRHANKLCDTRQDTATLMRIVIDRITKMRKQDGSDVSKTFPRTAFVIRQLKRPEEVRLLRSVYGKQFLLVSAYGSKDRRLKVLQKKLIRSLPVGTSEADINAKAMKLVITDEHEENDWGQNLRDTFHLADVFVDGTSKQKIDTKIKRFINAFFGRTDLTPSKAEYGMYAATSASLRSSDLSRQVGAAAFSDDGELITQGCNEVPKAFGGTYWDSEEPDHRDVKLGDDPNDVQKAEL
jgi:cytidine deaminase